MAADMRLFPAADVAPLPPVCPGVASQCGAAGRVSPGHTDVRSEQRGRPWLTFWTV